MASQQRVKRVIFNQAYAANTVVSIPVPRNYDLETLYVTITGTITYPGVLVAACVRNDAPFGLVQRCELIAEGRQTLFSVPGYVLGMCNIRRHKRTTYRERAETFDIHQTPPLAYTSPTTSMPISTAVPFAGTFAIDLVNIMGVRPKDTNLRTAGLQTLDLKLTLADLSSMFYPAAASVTPFAAPATTALPALTGYTMTPGSLIVSASEIQELRDNNGRISSPTWVQRWSHQDLNLASVQNDFQALLPTDNFMGNVFVTTKQTGESINGVINNFILRRGIDVRYNLPANTQRALSNIDYDMILPAGHYCLDLMGFGQQMTKLSDTWNLQGGADTRLSVDVAVANSNMTMGVTSVEYIPLRQG